MHVGRDDTSRRVRKLLSFGVSNMARPSNTRGASEASGARGRSRRSLRSTGRSGLRSPRWGEARGQCAQTVRPWVRRAEINAGKQPVVSTQEAEEPKRLKHENSWLQWERCSAIADRCEVGTVTQQYDKRNIEGRSADFFGAELDRLGRRPVGSSPNARATR